MSDSSRRANAELLSEILAAIDTPKGFERTKRYLAQRPFPHFEAAPDRPAHVLKIDEDGALTIGLFVNRQFRSAT
jgi:hypothetical protein